MAVQIIRQNGCLPSCETLSIPLDPSLGGVPLTILLFCAILGRDELRFERVDSRAIRRHNDGRHSRVKVAYLVAMFVNRAILAVNGLG